MMKRFRLVLLLAAAVLVPSAASAQWFVYPFAAGNAGGDTTDTSAAFGGSFGWMGRWIGAEGEIAVSPSFFDDGEGFRTNRRHTTYTASALVGPEMSKWRPYAVVGGGLLRSSIEEVGGLARLDDDRAGFHVGGGAMWSASRHVGLRGDLRYVRALDDEEPEGNVFAERFAEFAYWRFAAGVTVRW